MDGYQKVKPKSGIIVRFPRTYAILPESGGIVPWIGADGRYWRRRLSSGDVEVIQEEVAKIEEFKFKKKKYGEEEDK
jgi:hypothetical protein